MNNFNIEVKDFAKLSWCVTVSKIDVRAVIDKAVEFGDDYIIEGLHDGGNEPKDVLSSQFCLASGCILDKEKKELTIFTQAHTLDRVYLIKNKEEIFISNSLPLLLAKSKSKLDDTYLHYLSDFRNSIPPYKKCPLKKGEFYICYDTNIIINNNLEFNFQKKMKLLWF